MVSESTHIIESKRTLRKPSGRKAVMLHRFSKVVLICENEPRNALLGLSNSADSLYKPKSTMCLGVSSLRSMVSTMIKLARHSLRHGE